MQPALFANPQLDRFTSLLWGTPPLPLKLTGARAHLGATENSGDVPHYKVRPFALALPISRAIDSQLSYSGYFASIAILVAAEASPEVTLIHAFIRPVFDDTWMTKFHANFSNLSIHHSVMLQFSD